MKKRILAISFLTTLTFGYAIEPACAILDFNKNKQEEKTILDYVNFDWWKNLDDPYLEKYIVTAINNNHDIKTAQLKLEQAKINVQMTRSNLMPTLSVGASPMLAKLPGQTSTVGAFGVPIMASYELDLFGKNFDKLKSSKQILQSSQYQAQVSEISILSMVATVYYNIVKLDKLISIQEKLVQDREQIYKLMKLSNDEGLVSTSDLILAEKAFVMSQNELLDYQKGRKNALNALAVLIGDSAENTNEYERISLDELKDEIQVPDEISSDVIINRPDYKALEKQLEASGIDIRVAKKEFLPTIDILGLLGFAVTSLPGGGSMNWDSTLGLLAGNATLPLFTGFKRTANLKLNKNKYAQILEQYQKTNLVAIQEVNDSLYNLKADNEKYLNNIKALNIQKKDFNYSQLKFDEGIISKLDLLQQNESLMYMEKLAASSKIDCYIDRIGLYKATGAQL